MKLIHWGFIGCGDVVERKSGAAFSEVAGSDVVAVMSRSESRVRSFAERHGVKRWYTDAQKLIDDPEVNAVYVATPPSTHATFAIMAMRAGKPVYVEKPLASSYDDCIRINRVSEETGQPCFVAYYRRYLPYFQRVKQIVKDGTLGNIMNVQIRFTSNNQPSTLNRWRGFAIPDSQEHINHQPSTLNPQNSLPWRLRPEISGGGYFYDLAPHQLDLLQDIFGIIVKATGFCANRANRYPAEDNISACFLFESGVPASGSWCFTGDDSAKEDRIVIIGERGSLSFSVFQDNPIVLITRQGREEIQVPRPSYVQLPIIKSVIEDLQGFGLCTSTSISATPVNWVLDRVLGKF